MTRLTLTLLSLLCTTPLLAQGGEGAHVEFKGLPVNGSISALADSLRKGGCTLVEEGADSIILSGEFLGETGIRLIVHGNPSTKEAYGVSAYFDAGKTWDSVEARYHELVALVKTLYGRPDDHFEQFAVKVGSSGASRLKAIREGNCNYFTMWVVEGGMVVVSAVYDKPSYCICCTYQDDENAAEANEVFKSSASIR